MIALETRHLSILLTDIKGFTDKTSRKTRADIHTMLDEHRAVVLPLLESRGGRLIKTIGDAFLMTFESPTDAVLAGVAVQEALAKRNEGRAADDRLEIRIAINAGEVNLLDGDVFGEPVNITARIEGIAEAGQVYFTEAVYLAMNKTEIPSSEIGLMQLKGISEKIRVYKVRREEPCGAPAAFGPGVKAIPAASTAVPSSWRRTAALAIDAMICALILSFFVGSRAAHPRGSRLVHFSKTSSPPAKLEIDDNGIHGKVGDVKLAFDETGIHVESDKDKRLQQTIYDNGKGMKVTIDAADKNDEADGGSFARRLKSGRWDFALVWALYNLIFLQWLGASPGKRVLKLRVVALNGKPLDKRQCVLRSAFSLVSGYVMFLGYLWALWEPQRRTWHDLVAGTRVVLAE